MKIKYSPKVRRAALSALSWIPHQGPENGLLYRVDECGRKMDDCECKIGTDEDNKMPRKF